MRSAQARKSIRMPPTCWRVSRRASLPSTASCRCMVPIAPMADLVKAGSGQGSGTMRRNQGHVHAEQSVSALALTLGTVAQRAGAAETVRAPVSGQAGKDVVWVPSPPAMVNKMLEMAQGHADRLRDGPRLRRRAQRDCRRQARRARARRGIQPRHGGVVAKAGRRRPASPTRRSSSRATCTPPTSRRRPCSRCSCCR